MKNLFVILLSVFAFSFQLSAQVTKADIVQMMEDIGTSVDQIKTVYVGNVMTYYKDGTQKETYSYYEKDNGNEIVLTDTGIRIDWKPEDKIKSVYFVPYANIITFHIGEDYINIYLIR